MPVRPLRLYRQASSVFGDVMARTKRNLQPRDDDGAIKQPIDVTADFMEESQPPPVVDTSIETPTPQVAQKDEEEDLFGINAPSPDGKERKPSKLKQAMSAEEDQDFSPKLPGTRYVVMASDKQPKLTKKQQIDLEGWKHHDTRRSLFHNYMQAQADVARKKYGGGHGSVMLGSQTRNLVVGIPMPSFGMEFITRQSVFPLGIVMQLVATWGTGKSGAVAELLRWFDMGGGGGEYFENETKHSPEWFESFMGPEAYACLITHRCDSIDDWQRRLTDAIDGHKQRMDGTKQNPGPGRNIPLLFAVDSVMGKLKEETQKKILEEGVGGRGHPVEALAITRYVQTMSSWLDGWPFSVILVNHLKEKHDDKGQVLRSTAGGKHLNFQETFEIEMRKVGPKIDTVEFEGFHVEFVIEKNSLGGGNRRFRTRVLWWHEEDAGGDLKQVSVFDWDWSTVRLLADMLFSKDNRYTSPHLRHLLKKIGFHIEIIRSGDADNLAWSKNLNMTSAAPLPWHEVGAMIRQNENLLGRLRWALRIHTRPVLSNNYLGQRNSLAEEMP